MDKFSDLITKIENILFLINHPFTVFTHIRYLLNNKTHLHYLPHYEQIFRFDYKNHYVKHIYTIYYIMDKFSDLIIKNILFLINRPFTVFTYKH